MLGVASAGQSIHGKLGGEWVSVLRTVPGWCYWLSRGIIPVGCYAAFFVVKLDSHHSFTTALLCGLGSEAVLRSQFFIGTNKTAAGKTQDVYKGVFDLIEWYQGRLLLSASNRLAASRSRHMNTLVGGVTDFPKLCQKCRTSAASFQMNCDTIRDIVDKTLLAFQKETAVKNGTAPVNLHRNYAFELGYALMAVVGRKYLGVLFGYSRFQKD